MIFVVAITISTSGLIESSRWVNTHFAYCISTTLMSMTAIKCYTACLSVSITSTRSTVCNTARCSTSTTRCSTSNTTIYCDTTVSAISMSAIKPISCISSVTTVESTLEGSPLNIYTKIELIITLCDNIITVVIF